MSTIKVTENLLKQLSEPLPMKWRVRQFYPKNNPTTAIMVGYVDSRDIQDRLDYVVGISNWQTEYYECKGKQFCKIGIKIDGEWVWKADSGTESQTEKEKGETSDAFKRSAVHWGINRIGYKMGEVRLKCKLYELDGKYYPIDSQGNFLKGAKLQDVCNKLARVEDIEHEFNAELISSKSISKESINDLYELKLNIINVEMKNNIKRILDNEETDKYKSVYSYLKYL